MHRVAAPVQFAFVVQALARELPSNCRKRVFVDKLVGQTLDSLVDRFIRPAFKALNFREFKYVYPDAAAKVLCPICKEVFEDPVRACKNNHHLCRECANTLCKFQRVCPCCRDPILQNFSSDVFLKQAVDDLLVSCPNEAGGCHETFIREALPSHVEICPFAYTPKDSKELRYAVDLYLKNGEIAGCGEISAWNVAAVTDMTSLFRNASKFNEPLNNWNTAQVTNMWGLFSGAESFNQALNRWNTAQVTGMTYMFKSATSFDQPLDKWITARVTDMEAMFYFANRFNQNLSIWNTAKVTDMSQMFVFADQFNHALNTWNTAQVTSMYSMFWHATNFNQPLDSWNTAQVTDMSDMFRFARVFNQPVGTWNTAQVTTMNRMFRSARDFNQAIDTWNTNKVTDMYQMLTGAQKFNNPFTWNST